jgi:hypothetical protein
MLLLSAPGYAVDHNNIDAGRPLTFDDAESIAFRERAIEMGFGLGVPKGRPVGLELDGEFLYGFALNTHLSIGFDPSIGGRADTEDTDFDFGDVSVGLFHNFNREIGNTPAIAVRGDVFLPTGRDSDSVGVRLRGIASKTVRQYSRLHLNVDLSFNPGADDDEREFTPAFSLGYSRPLGYPRRFTRTGVAELSVLPSAERGQGPVIRIGAGLRQQVTVSSVLDLGIQSDVAGFDGAPRDRVRLIAGYSTGY